MDRGCDRPPALRLPKTRAPCPWPEHPTETLTLLSDGSLTTYDLTGTVLDSKPTTIEGPLVWLESR